MNRKIYTHQVAVNAYLLRAEKFLLLKRKTSPFIWAPPGGRLKKDEDPIAGLQREIQEETNLKVEVIAPVNTWFGKWKEHWLLSIDFLVHYKSGHLRLSAEHSRARWVSMDELRKGKPIKLDDIAGFHLSDFENAWKLNNFIKTQ